MCGIAGFNGGENKTPNMDAMKILGILNEERGKDSAGIVINNSILKKGHKTTFRELVSGFKFNPKEIKGNVMIHTRAATVGALTDDNAHPYIYEQEGKPSMIFMHNGTIRNIESLVALYKTDVTGYLTDSRKLGQILYDGHFEVLTKYSGAASIAFYYLDKPNEIFLWNGAAEDYNGFLQNERGLYYSNPSPGVMYFSSQEDHLGDALNQPGKVEMVPQNTLCKFVNGKLVEQKPYSRAHMRYIGYQGVLGYSEEKVTATNTALTSVWPFNSGKTTIRIVREGYLAEFALVHYMHGNITEGHIYYDGYKYVRTTGDSEVDAHGVFNLNTAGFMTDSGHGVRRYFLEGVMVENRETYEDLLVKSKHMTAAQLKEAALNRCDPETIYLSSQHGRFRGQFTSFSSITQPSRIMMEANMNGVFKIPFSPFIFLMEKGGVKAFKIDSKYVSFFNWAEMSKQLSINEKKLKKMVVGYESVYLDFEEFVLDLYDTTYAPKQTPKLIDPKLIDLTGVDNRDNLFNNTFGCFVTDDFEEEDLIQDTYAESKGSCDKDCVTPIKALRNAVSQALTRNIAIADMAEDEVETTGIAFDEVAQIEEAVEEVTMGKVLDEITSACNALDYDLIEVDELLAEYCKNNGHDSFAEVITACKEKLEKVLKDVEQDLNYLV